MSETKPTAGALRAAGAIYAYMLPKDQLDDKVCYYLAEIIDRETAGPKVEELLEAAEQAKGELRYYPGESNKEGDAEVDAAHSRIQAAIRAVEAALGGKAE